ncbi:MAG: molybdenum ABC transporter ATP-binding protein [Pseudomonadota bacterium]|nr:molybdenum ABC transporter ATP-binding protein [Pseudomonadota bacterium]
MSLSVDLRTSLGAFTVNAQFDSSGSTTALFGKSGAGKTSIVQMIAGLIRPQIGRIIIGEHTVFDNARNIDIPAHQRRVGYVFQDARLFPHMSVRRNLDYGHRRRGGGDFSPTFDDVVDVLAIAPLLDRRTHLLSGGECQRVAIGRALLSGPRVLLMDEPLASLDETLKAEIIPFIVQVQEEFRLPIVYVSHSVNEVLKLADTMVLLADGAVAAVGAVEEVMNRPDLVRITDTGDAGTVIPVRVTATDDTFGIATVTFKGGEFLVPITGLQTGGSLRLHVRARDVSLALKKPENVSVLNIFEGTVTSVSNNNQPQMDISIDVGGTIIWSQITQKSVLDLKIAPGRRVFAMVKAVAIDPPVTQS